jgi:DNA-binding GntR family transcriptional regulator
MRFEKLSTKTLRQKVYDQLRQKIISAEISPGETITMRELAQAFGVSLMPIREALWQLESEKVIVIESNKSIHVNTLTANEVNEILLSRLALESMAVKRACELRPQSALPKVKYYLDGMRNNLKNHRQYLTKNKEFHFSIYSCSESPIFLQLIGLLWSRIGPYLFIQASRGGDISGSMECHEGMYEALCERNKNKIVKFLRRDLEETAKFIIPFLEANNSKQKIQKGGE